VDTDHYCYETLILMTRHSKRRLVIQPREGFNGFVEDNDSRGFFTDNSQLIPRRIERALGIEDLVVPARDIQSQVERLHGQGVRVDVIASITSDLNRRLLAKLFELVAPRTIREGGCLMLMGSEGRSEQTARTDQDNGILLARPVALAELQLFRDAFSGALYAFGFPACPGQVAVGNPIWSQPVEDFITQLRSWVLDRTPKAAMQLAIFFDSIAVGGHTELLLRARAALIHLIRGEAMLLSHMARLIETFAIPGFGRLSRLRAFWATVDARTDVVDIKRSGTFPIVHGIRTLALDRSIMAESTAARVDNLVDDGTLGREQGRELVNALGVFMEFRLRSQLAAIRRGNLEYEAMVHPSSLSSADRDILRHAFRITCQFREAIRERYALKTF